MQWKSNDVPLKYACNANLNLIILNAMNDRLDSVAKMVIENPKQYQNKIY